MKRPFSQLDVFTDLPLKGNPLAVVHDADGLDDETMQALARWTNLSETAFLLRPTAGGPVDGRNDVETVADYRVRIFTPGGELPFAGHPTLGACHAWLARGGQARQGDEIVQECGIGLVRIRRDGERLAFAAPPVRMTPVDAELLGGVLDALGLRSDAVLASQWLDNGPQWLALRLVDASSVLVVEPDHEALKKLAKVGLIGPHGAGAECRFEVRGFAPSIGVPEDPVTGSLNASLGQWLIGSGDAPERYVAAQGTRLGRAGRVHVERIGGTVWVGGSTVACIRGEIDI